MNIRNKKKEELLGLTVLEMKLENLSDLESNDVMDVFNKYCLDFCNECLTVLEISDMVRDNGDSFICVPCLDATTKESRLW